MWHVATMATIITLHFWNKMSGRRLNNTARSRATNSGAGRNANASGKVFNPRLIFSQIVALQCFHYLVLGFMFQINHVLYNNSVTIDRMFTDKFLNLWSIGGWADNAAVLLSSLVCSALMSIIVEKSKKVLDFSLTLFIIHFLACVFYNGMPGTWDWWIIHVLGTIMMVLMGEYLCSKRELDDIPLLTI